MTTQEQFDTEHMVRTDGKIHLEPINLDSCCEEDLKIAREHPALHREVQYYAHWKLTAMRARLDGDIDLALSIEKKCDRAYSNMPKSCRW